MSHFSTYVLGMSWGSRTLYTAENSVLGYFACSMYVCAFVNPYQEHKDDTPQLDWGYTQNLGQSAICELVQMVANNICYHVKDVIKNDAPSYAVTVDKKIGQYPNHS